jgi:hypothetical protein
LNDKGTSFEPERNVIQFAYGLDGGGSVAADEMGDVYVAWHSDAGEKSESNRRVWLARSTDEGKNFLKEIAVSPKSDGACGCCGMRALTDHQNNVYLLYRTAKQGLQRDITLLYSDSKGSKFKSLPVDGWELQSCPMTTSHLFPLDRGVLGTWETKGKVFFSNFSTDGEKKPSFSAPNEGENSKHPALAKDGAGDVLMAWTEGTGWEKGGSLAWQVFDKNNHPTQTKGRVDNGVPTWSFPAAVGTSEGFLLFY